MSHLFPTLFLLFCKKIFRVQLYLARTMLESLIHEKSSSTGRRVYRKDLDEKYREKMVEF